MSEGNEVQSIPEGSRCYGEINEDRGWGGRGGTITVLPTLGPRGLMTERTDIQSQMDSDTGDRPVSVSGIRSVTG